MKKKFIILTLCFTIVFSSINYKKSYANPFILPLIAPELIASIATVAVGVGVQIANDDDVLDVARLFYEDNKSNWSEVEKVLSTGITIGSNKIVNVSKDVLSLFKNSFDKIFSNADYSNSKSIAIDSVFALPVYPSKIKIPLQNYNYDSFKFTIGNLIFEVGKHVHPGSRDNCSSSSNLCTVYGNKLVASPGFDFSKFKIMATNFFAIPYDNVGQAEYFVWTEKENNRIKLMAQSLSVGNTRYPIAIGVIDPIENSPFGGTVDLPYKPGSYDWDKVKDNENEKDGSLDIFVPGNTASLPGVVGGGTIAKPGISNPPYELPREGVVSIPRVANPSLDIGNSVAIPNTGVIDKPATGEVDKPIDKPVFPMFPSFGDTLDFKPMEMTGISEKFPFSLPWDVKRLVSMFDVEPKAPIFKVKIVSEEIKLDLSMFDKWANITRFFVLIGFILSLIFISTKLKG